MIFYSKAYIGARLGINLRGVEVDKVNPQTWKRFNSSVKNIGNLRFFAAAAPYLSAIKIGAKVGRIIVKALNRNDRIITE